MASLGPAALPTGGSPAALRAVRAAPVAARAAAILLAYGLLAALAVRLGPSGWALLPAAACGFLLSGFLNAAHDCVHDTHLATRRLNRIAGAAWCTPILVNFTLYKRQHLVHHRFTGVEGDTEAHAHFASPGAYLLMLSGAQFWRSILLRIVKTFRGDFPPSIRTREHLAQARADNAAICLWLAAMLAATLAFPVPLLLGYWLPLLFYPPFAIFFSLPEHHGLTGADRHGPRSRNMVSNALVRLVQWNANFHAAHHRAPNIPAAALGRFYRRAAPAPGDAHERSYLRFHAVLLSELWSR